MVANNMNRLIYIIINKYHSGRQMEKKINMSLYTLSIVSGWKAGIDV